MSQNQTNSTNDREVITISQPVISESRVCTCTIWPDGKAKLLTFNIATADDLLLLTDTITKAMAANVNKD